MPKESRKEELIGKLVGKGFLIKVNGAVSLLAKCSKTVWALLRKHEYLRRRTGVWIVQ